MPETIPTPQVGLKKSVKLIDLVTLGAGTAIGASIFSILGPSSQVAGSGILITTLLAALPMSVFGLVYAFMSSAYPRSGASYEWQRIFVHPMLGFVVVWLRIMGTALILNVMGNVLINYLTAMVSVPLPGRLIVFGFFTAVFAVNYLGVAVAARAQTVVMAMLLVVFAIFVAASAPSIDLARIGSPVAVGVLPIVAALPLMIHLFMGIETCTEVGEEVENAERMIPLGLLLALCLCGVVYILIAFSSLGLIGPAALGASKAPLLSAAQASLGRWALPLIGVAAVLALTKSMNAIFLVYSRFLFAMGRSAVFSPLFARIHPRFGTPYVATIGAYVGASVCLFLPNDLIFLFLATTIPNMLKYFSTCLASIQLVRHHPEIHVRAQLRFPGIFVKAIAVVGMIAALAIAVVGLGVDWKPYALIGAWLVAGLVYWAFRRRRVSPVVAE